MKKSEKLVDFILDGRYNRVKKFDKQIDRIIDECMEKVKEDNEVPTGEVNADIKTSKDEVKKDVAEKPEGTLTEKKVNKIINLMIKELREQVEKDVTMDDLKDYFDDLRAKGFKDEKKLQGMLDRAKEIAAGKGKANDRQAIIGILQSFMGGK